LIFATGGDAGNLCLFISSDAGGVSAFAGGFVTTDGQAQGAGHADGQVMAANFAFELAVLASAACA
jgi:hypothetical protein